MYYIEMHAMMIRKHVSVRFTILNEVFKGSVFTLSFVQ